MKAWMFNGAGKPLELAEVPDPVAKPGEIVIDVKASGLCHSDVSALDDPNWSVNFGELPVVLGHEPVGVVTQLGEGVTNLRLGDRVGIPSGPPNVNGYFRDGGYAEKTTAIATEVVKIPASLDFIRAASGTDAGNVAHHAVVTRGQVAAGQKVGIIGIGGLGQIGARIAVLKGAEVYAAEIKKDVWPMAEELGVVRCVEDVRELTDVGLDTIVDFAGFGTTTMGAMESVREYGRVVQVGMGRLVFEFNSNPLIVRQIELIGSMGGGVEDLSGVYEMMASGGLDPKITTTTFAKIAEGLDLLRQGKVRGRMVVDMQNGI
ncbi:alcohol dehydrogenase catalytic domain-containing protein [Georgenia yuyongxinii]|uniref:alcohol dehydrogenase n=1 Tax=Georgenia yuyongxinii TaxID=2589797 RepID=A0A552WNR9_9MICO|nr:alcohol dehydrogenase catalytic domain-containing protein [Georgenia yuyongxinii]TRW44143.1 zinc-binding dehydrogenase [Georgenia yuyongxinii]